MAKRNQTLIQPWAWVDEGKELNRENLENSYRLNSKQHTNCRKNCRLNPRCLTGFGELGWCLPTKDVALVPQRSAGTFAGLKNLGNTCYINCFLQLWFHNEPLRQALYLWDALQDPAEISKHSELSFENYEPKSSVAHLQLLFADMEFGIQKYCDPEDFCKSLSIDVKLQQDAQEFGKLYMNCLEATFSNSTNEITKNVIKSQFRGKYSYATTCSHCKTVSRRQSDFYELELNIKKTILDSLKEFIREDNLIGDDKYFCANCNQKQDATRCIQLEELPQVLQLQLLRYYYDVATSSKKKITQGISFPDNLDLSQYVGKPEGTEVYSLQAVLMHGGTSANTGHYYAHINTQEGWHVFDDINVKKQKQLSLINDEPLAKNGEKKMKGFRSSSAAYMLVYRKLSSNNGINELKPVLNDLVKTPEKLDTLPFYLQKLLEKRNEMVNQSSQIQEIDYEKKCNHQSFLEIFFKTLPLETIEYGEFIHIDAIKNLKSTIVPPLDSSSLLCSHGFLDVKKYKEYKFVSSKAVEMYIDRFGGGPRLPISKLCLECVSKCAALIRNQAALKADVKLATQLLKSNNSPGFWVSKKSIKNWWTQIDIPEDETDDFKNEEEFNADITCPHGGLLHAEAGRRLISQQCWDLFKKYFPNCKEFPENTEPCSLCKNDAQVTQENQRIKAREEMTVLQSLINERRDVTENTCYMISLMFVTAWRRYVRSATLQVLKERPLPNLAFQSLLCNPHQLLICNPSTDFERIFILTPDEWTTLKNLYGLTNEIKLEKQEDGSILCSVGPCEDCIAELECQEESYFGAKIYVYKVTNEVDEESLDAAESELKKTGQKRKMPLAFGPAIKKTTTDCVRRSARTRTSKEEKISFVIDKFTTLRDLKIMIFHQLSVLPCDQHLSLDGHDLDDLKISMELKDEEATLLKLRVPPSSTLRLLADEPSPDQEAVTESLHEQPEPGFKGTGLGGCFFVN